CQHPGSTLATTGTKNCDATDLVGFSPKECSVEQARKRRREQEWQWREPLCYPQARGGPEWEGCDPYCPVSFHPAPSWTEWEEEVARWTEPATGPADLAG